MANKLELTWYGKDVPIHAEPRILIEHKELSNTVLDPDTQNMLIHGDNLLALKALEKKYAGKVKCIYIDPPYNTGSAFEHYDDNLEHSIWLNLMRPRLEILRNLLSENGAICVQIDVVEMGYLKVLMDEIFGRNNHINTISVKTKIAGVSGSNLGKSLQDNIEYLLLYAKNFNFFKLNTIPQKKQELIDYINNYAIQAKSLKYTTVLKNIDEGEIVKEFISGNSGTVKLYRHQNFELCSINQIADEDFSGNKKEAYYAYIESVLRTTNAQTSIRRQVIEETREFNGRGMFSIEYTPIKGKNAGIPTRFYYKDNNLIAWLRDVVDIEDNTIYKIDNMGNLWDDIQYNNLTKEGNVQFPNGKKPESLVGRVVGMLSSDGDIVLDSFLGSGTTAAVAHKMGRKWIGIELGEHAYTHCKVRLNTVIAGEDTGGITESTKWQGGGGYKFYELAPTLINEDSIGEPVINREYDAEMLAAAVALHEGFTYQPDHDYFWKQSIAYENSYLFVTTKHLTRGYLDSIKDTMQDDEHLIIACCSYDTGMKSMYNNITIKKIPQMLLGRCKFGEINYNLNIVDPPIYEDEEAEDEERI